MLDVNIAHRFPDFNLNVTFQSGAKVTALFGPSGAGKTTILNAVAGLFTPDSGRVSLDGSVVFDRDKDVNHPPHLRSVGYVFQSPRLFPHMTVLQNMMYGTTGKMPSDDIAQVLGIDHLLSRRPKHLSGGEQQRVAIARAVLRNPKLLLMDEPLSSLDADRRAAILPYLNQLAQSRDLPVLMVTHDMGEVAQLADHLVVLRDGQVIQSGAVSDVLSDPAAVPDIGVRNAGAVVTAVVTKAPSEDGLTQITLGGQSLYFPNIQRGVGATVKVRVLAQDVILAKTKPADISALNILSVTLKKISAGHGPGAAIQLSVGDQTLLARVTKRSVQALKLEAGQNIYAIVKATAISRGNIG